LQLTSQSQTCGLPFLLSSVLVILQLSEEAYQAA
jgi:hypothetical protein